jgi:hypothetical protein
VEAAGRWPALVRRNQFLLIAKGNVSSMFMNGHLISVFIDNDPTYFRPSGKIGLEVEATGAYSTRNIWLKRMYRVRSPFCADRKTLYIGMANLAAPALVKEASQHDSTLTFAVRAGIAAVSRLVADSRKCSYG